MKLKNIFYASLIIEFPILSISTYASQVVVVSANNSAEIRESNIPRIFLGKIKSFSSGDSILPINQKPGSDSRVEFDKKVLGKSGSQVKAYWSKLMFSGKGKPPKEMTSDSAVKAYIAENPNAIGYIDEANVDATVKVVMKI